MTAYLIKIYINIYIVYLNLYILYIYISKLDLYIYTAEVSFGRLLRPWSTRRQRQSFLERKMLVMVVFTV